LKRFISLICFSFIAILLIAKSSPDSLRKIWNNNLTSDTDRLKSLHLLILDHYIFPDPDSAIILGQVMLEFSKGKKIKSMQARAFNVIAWGAQNKGEYEKSLSFNKTGLKLAEESNDSVVIGMCLSDMGTSLLVMGEFINAYKCLLNALKINRAMKNKIYESYTLCNIGNVFLSLGEVDKAEYFYLEQLKLNDSLADKQSIAAAVSNLGNIYDDRGDTVNTLKYWNKGLQLSIEGGFDLFAAVNYNNHAEYYMDHGQFSKATENITALKILADKLNSASLLSNYYILQCQLMQQFGNYTESLPLCEKGLELCNLSGDLETKIIVVNTLYEINKFLLNYEKALMYHETLLSLQDTFDVDAAKIDIQRSEFNQQLLIDSLIQLDKERQTRIFHDTEVRKKNITRNYLLAGFLVIFVFAGGLFKQLRYVRKSKSLLQLEKDRSENLLLNILPAEIADELKLNGFAIPRDFEMVSILFTDFKEFTETSEKLTPNELVNELNCCFHEFDLICEKYHIEKIKTIGDAYMAAGGLPAPSSHAVKNTVLAAIEMAAFMTARNKSEKDNLKTTFEMRVGIHTGPVVAGIVGVKKFQYDVWGDTVNTASRIENNGSTGKVNISETTYQLINNESCFHFKERGKIDAKGKGMLGMWYVEKSLLN
jgi:class 3 adenylate cyclase